METKYLKVKKVTVFDSIGSGRRAKTSPSTYTDVYAIQEGSFIYIQYVHKDSFDYKADIFSFKKSMNSKYFELDARGIKKESFNRALNKQVALAQKELDQRKIDFQNSQIEYEKRMEENAKYVRKHINIIERKTSNYNHGSCKWCNEIAFKASREMGIGISELRDTLKYMYY